MSFKNYIDTKSLLIQEIGSLYKKVEDKLSVTPCIGVLGGVGPRAGLDMLDKIMQLTPARNDQGHMQTLLYTCPGIPDRTKALEEFIFRQEVGLSKSLVDKTAQAILGLRCCCPIVIACNTLHAFLEDQEYHGIKLEGVLSFLKRLGIEPPILHIAQTCAVFVKKHFPEIKKIGILATTGSNLAQVYQTKLEDYGFEVILPDETIQKSHVMTAVYGPYGVKALQSQQNDFSIARDLLVEAWEHLVSKGAQIGIQGCTEVPLALKDEKLPMVDASFVLAGAAITQVLQELS